MTIFSTFPSILLNFTSHRALQKHHQPQTAKSAKNVLTVWEGGGAIGFAKIFLQVEKVGGRYKVHACARAADGILIVQHE